MAPPVSQYIFDLPHRVSYAPQDFVVTDSNRDAHAVAARSIAWPAPIMAVSGPTGSGKTHLAHLFAQMQGARFIDAAALGAQVAEALLAGADAFVLELPDTIAQEEALAQCINAVLAKEASMLVTSRVALAQRAVKRPDLSSRLKAIPDVKLHAPDDALLVALFSKAFADRQLRAGEEVIAYLVKRVERSGGAVGRLVAQLDRKALAAGQALTVPFVRDSLSDFR